MRVEEISVSVFLAGLIERKTFVKNGFLFTTPCLHSAKLASVAGAGKRR
jgi:hypothetical protein